MTTSNKKDWLVRTRSREILGPFTQSELVQQLRKNTFTSQDEICNNLGNWLSASVLSNQEVEEITRTSSRMGTQSIEFTKSDLTPTPTTTEKIDPNSENHQFQNSNPSRPPAISAHEGSSGSYQSSNEPNANSSPRPQSLSMAAKYPLLTAVVLSFLAVFFLNRQGKPLRQTSQVDQKSIGSTEDTTIVRRSKQLIKLGKNKQALKELGKYHESNNKNDTSYLTLYAGLLITEGESVLRAKRLLEQVLNSSAVPKTKSEAHLWLGYLLLSEDESDMGESHFLEALQLNPRDASARFNLGRAYLKQEKYQQALEYFQLAELELPNFWLIHVYKGWAKFSLKFPQDASKAFKLAVSESKDRWASYFYQAIFYFRTQELELARDTLIKMLGRDPQYEALSPIPFGFFQERSSYDEYQNAFDQILEKAPEEERLMGKLYLTYLNNPLSRGEDWRKMDALANRSHNILIRLLSIKMMLPHVVDMGYLKSSLSKLPSNLDYFGPYAYVIRGQARERLSQLPEAQLDYRKALALDPDCASAMWFQFDLYRKLHRAEEAKNTLESLLSTHPNYIPALEEMANIE